MRVALLSVLRGRLMDAYERYVDHGDHPTTERRQCIDKEYAAYKLNGGNSTGDDLYAEIRKVPIKVVGEDRQKEDE